MNYNDIKSRLERTFFSIDERFDGDIDFHTHEEHWKDGRGVTLTFGSENDPKVLNKVMSILHNLASLKDHLKNCLKTNGFDPQIVENTVNNSIHLQVMIDIVNQEKHGSPLRRPRSSKNPIISDVSNSFRLASKKRADLTNIGKEIDEEDGPPTMFIDALIRDDKGKLIFRLDELIEECYDKWENLAIEFDCAKEEL